MRVLTTFLLFHDMILFCYKQECLCSTWNFVQYNKITKISGKVMQQLETIFWQRNTDITALKQQQKQLKKQDFQQRERIRIQRQNWILKIIKTIKILSIDNKNKRNIYASVIRMMSYYREGYEISEEIDYEKNFTEEIINLFIGFYSECGFGDTSVVKKIVRPNNAFIVIDLIKQLVETHRQLFKVKLLETYKQAPKLVEERAKTKILPIVLSRRQLPATEPSEAEQTKKQPIGDGEHIYVKLKQVIFQKWQNFVSYNLPTQQVLKNKMNDTYLQLLERNSQNNFMIHKFQQKCFGRSRSFAYNVSGLYTQQQIKQMQNKLKFQVKQKFVNIKQLKGDPSADQLKQYFKIKVQIQDSYDKIQSKRQNIKQVNQWVPLVVQKLGYQHNPLNVYIIFAKDQIPIEQFPQKCGISLKNYLRMIVKNKFDQFKQQKQLNQLNQLRNFKRHHFFDLNHAKKKQLMSDQHRVYQKSKKQSIFPILRSNELRQQTQIALKNRSMSQYKLAPIFKNDIITRRLQDSNGNNEGTEQEPTSASLQLMKLQESKLNISERKDSKQWPKRKESVRVGKSKIDNIIEQIISQRNLTLIN